MLAAAAGGVIREVHSTKEWLTGTGVLTPSSSLSCALQAVTRGDETPPTEQHTVTRVCVGEQLPTIGVC